MFIVVHSHAYQRTLADNILSSQSKAFISFGLDSVCSEPKTSHSSRWSISQGERGEVTYIMGEGHYIDAENVAFSGHTAGISMNQGEHYLGLIVFAHIEHASRDSVLVAE
jgi:hypothetical protein